jgi:hypothetical protein
LEQRSWKEAVDALAALLPDKATSQEAVAVLEKIGNLKALAVVEKFLREIEAENPGLDSFVYKASQNVSPRYLLMGNSFSLSAAILGIFIG